MNKKNSDLYENQQYLDRSKFGGLEKFYKIYRDWDYRHVIKMLDNKTDILDLGCGRGEFLFRLKDKNKNLFGVDISNLAIGRAKKILKNADLKVGDIANINYKNNSFDAVVCLHVLEHIKDPEKLMKKIYSFLVDDGVLIIRIPNNSSWEARVGGKYWFHYDYPYHINFFTSESIRNLLRESGFKNIRVRYDLLEYRQTFLYAVLQSMGIKKIGRWLKLLLLPIQIVFVPLSYLVAKLFNESGTIELVAFKQIFD